jgi:hypothetical protein
VGLRLKLFIGQYYFVGYVDFNNEMEYLLSIYLSVWPDAFNAMNENE